jgi:hypothetical protein
MLHPPVQPAFDDHDRQPEQRTDHQEQQSDDEVLMKNEKVRAVRVDQEHSADHHGKNRGRDRPAHPMPGEPHSHGHPERAAEEAGEQAA